MGKNVLLPLVIAASLLFTACENKNTTGAMRIHGDVQAEPAKEPAFVTVIKKAKLPQFQEKNIGTAFDSYHYFTQKEWRADQLKNGHATVDFIGWLDPQSSNEVAVERGVSGSGIDITFVVNIDGSYFVLSAAVVEKKRDGSISRTGLLDRGTVLKSIYGNRKIEL